MAKRERAKPESEPAGQPDVVIEEAAPAAAIEEPQPLEFPVSADSPFPDGYDIAAERDALADLVAAENPDQGDPRWSRYLELSAREERLRQMNATPTQRQRVQSVVPGNETRSIADLEQLTDSEPDTMTLHTRDAFRMFTGRHADPEGKVVSIAGGKRFAGVLKSIWYLSGNDNPYADWILIRMYEGLMTLRDRLAEATRERERTIALLRQRGLALSVMLSRSPKTVELGFKSPYGYATADLIVEFDYYVRMVKTLIRKDRMSDAEGGAAIRGLSRKMRALFLEPVRWERYLLREELRRLSRSDFLPGADQEARIRVTAAAALFGELPRDVFTGIQAPRHSKRRVKLSDAELRLLEQAPLTFAQDEVQNEAELL